MFIYSMLGSLWSRSKGGECGGLYAEVSRTQGCC